MESTPFCQIDALSSKFPQLQTGYLVIKNIGEWMIEPKQPLQAAWIGSMAQETIRQDRSGTVLGTTSTGIYLRPSGRWLLFLSTEIFRGPLTINLLEPAALLHTLAAGMPFVLEPERIRIPEVEAEIRLTDAEIWQPPAIGPTSGHTADRIQRLAALAARVFSHRPGGELSPLLPLLFENSTPIPEKKMPPQPAFDALTAYAAGAVSGTPFRLKDALESALGLGRGLTPAGDDFILGLLLAMNRRPDSGEMNAETQRLNATAVEAAYRHTTTLSANLIEAATYGLADERLTSGLDWIMNGTGEIEAVADRILGWGSASGVAVLAGIGVGLLSDVV